jgi:cell division septum initiation protein DivIVA
MEISLETAHAVACQKLGEALVREEVMIKMADAKDALIHELQNRLKLAEEAGFVIEEATEIIEGAAADANQRDDQGERVNGSVPPAPPEG